jgi:L-iditol 2-dehydrogenase
MRASRIVRRGEVAFVEVTPQTPGPGEVIVRPVCLSLCGSDIFHYLYMADEAYPQAVGTSGHEMVGNVEAVGSGVAGIETGMQVLALSPDQTAMTEQYRAKAECVLPLPKGRPLEELLMAQQLGTVVYAVRRLPNVVGATAAVIGQGSAGIFWAQMLRRLGCSRVVVMDLREARVTAGRRFGADMAFNNGERDPREAVREATGGRGADIVVEAAGEPDSVNLAARLVKERGILCYFGIPHAKRTVPEYRDGFPFDYDTFFRSHAVTFTTSGAMLDPDKSSFRIALDLIARGDVDARGMVTHRVPFHDLSRAYELARTGADGAVKVLVDMPGRE